MTTVTERFPLDDITAQARDVHFWRTILTGVLAVLFGTGWLAAKTCTVLWLAVAWAAIAIRQGWREGRGHSTEPRGPSSAPR